MDAVQQASLASGVVTTVIFLAGTIELIRNRNAPIIRANMPVISVMINVGYIMNTISTTNQSITNNEPCITYLWLTFIPISLMTAGYLLKIVQIYVLSLVEDKMIAELAKMTKEEAKTNLKQQEKDGETKIDVEPFSDDIHHTRRCSSLRSFILDHEYIGSTDFLVKTFFVIFGVSLLIPIFINASEPVYWHPTDGCGQRTIGEIVGLVILILMFVMPFLYLLFQLRGIQDAYGIKTQIKGISVSWIIVVIFIGLFFSIPNEGWKDFGKIFTPAILLPQFYFGTILPLYKTYKAKHKVHISGSSSPTDTRHSSIRDYAQSETEKTDNNNSSDGDKKKPNNRSRVATTKTQASLTFYDILQYKDKDYVRLGFNSLYQCAWELDIRRNNPEYYYRNAIVFSKDYTEYIEELGEVAQQKSVFAAGRLFIMYQKFFSTGGKYSHDNAATTPVPIGDKELKDKIVEVVIALQDENISEDTSLQLAHSPEELIKQIHDKIKNKYLIDVYRAYVTSNYFDLFTIVYKRENQLVGVASTVIRT